MHFISKESKKKRKEKGDTEPVQRGETEPRLQRGFHSQALRAGVQNSSCKEKRRGLNWQDFSVNYEHSVCKKRKKEKVSSRHWNFYFFQQSVNQPRSLIVIFRFQLVCQVSEAESNITLALKDD